MFGYYGSNKRSRDTMVCQECEEEEFDTESDDWAVCGDCQRAMCSDCMKQECTYCRDLWEQNEEFGPAEGSSICESCMSFCKDCDDAVFHKECLVEHLKVCNKKTRAQRALASVKKEREQTEEKLKEAKRQLAELQHRVEGYEKDLVCLKDREAKADLELKAEVEAGEKKQSAK